MQRFCPTRFSAALTVFLLLVFAAVSTAHAEDILASAQGKTINDGSACTLCAMSAVTAVVHHFVLPAAGGRIDATDNVHPRMRAACSQPAEPIRAPPSSAR